MALDIYSAEDIRNAILAADQASANTVVAMQSVVGDPKYLRVYRQGYRDALATIATAFDIGFSAGVKGVEDRLLSRQELPVQTPPVRGW